VERFWPNSGASGFLILGDTNTGKTLLLGALGMAKSRQQIKLHGRQDLTPGFRTAPETDCFRFEMGSVFKPDMKDDGDLNNDNPRVLKAFFDVGLEEAVEKVRYGCAKWVQGQMRGAADNKILEEPSIVSRAPVLSLCFKS